MKGFNKVMLIGNTGADPIVKTLEGNIKVANFSLGELNSTYLYCRMFKIQ